METWEKERYSSKEEWEKAQEERRLQELQWEEEEQGCRQWLRGIPLLPLKVAQYIRAAYRLGINPLPALRKRAMEAPGLIPFPKGFRVEFFYHPENEVSPLMGEYFDEAGGAVILLPAE